MKTKTKESRIVFDKRILKQESVMNKLAKFIRKIVGQEKVMNQLFFIEQNQRELLKANMSHDVISESEWLKYKNFLVGGAAIDYACSYTLFRVLNQMKPQHILEFGL